MRTLFKKVVLETLQESSQVFTFVDEFASTVMVVCDPHCTIVI